MQIKSRNPQIFITLALGSEFAYLGIASLDTLKTHVVHFLIFYGTVFLFYWFASCIFFDIQNSDSFNSPEHKLIPYKFRNSLSWLGALKTKIQLQQNLSRRETLIIGIFFGLLFRITLLFTTPGLSDDIYRYIWDGKVSTHDINPYLYAPDAEELTSLRDAKIYPDINHKEIPTVYPPVAQITFFGFFRINASVTIFKIGFMIFDLLTILFLFFILKDLSLSPRRLLVYVWNPLIIIEFAGSGHVDIAGIMFLTIVFYLIIQNRLLWANLALVLSSLVKFISIIFLPALFVLKRENKLIIPILFTFFGAVFYLPYADAGTGLFAALANYASKWEFNNSLFSLLKSGLGEGLLKNLIVKLILKPATPNVPDDALWTQGYFISLAAVKGVIIFIFLIIMLYYLKRLQSDIKREGSIWIFELGIILLGTYILFSPTVHPWYLCWLVPFLVIKPNRAWLLLTGLIVLSYWVLIGYTKTGVWHESTWIKYIEYLPFYTLLIYDFARNKFQNKESTCNSN